MHILNFNFLDIIYRFRYLISLNELPSLNFITITYEITIFLYLGNGFFYKKWKLSRI